MRDRFSMPTSQLLIHTPPHFHLWRTVFSHGWCSLPPFSVDQAKHTFGLLLRLSDGNLARCSISNGAKALTVEVQMRGSLTHAQKQVITTQLSASLRLDEDLSDFYSIARKHRRFQWIPRLKAGRLLRAPTVFEDVVKMICTTNCTWALTTIMVTNLTTKLGERFDDGLYSFPTPERLAGATERFLRKEVRAGYRSPYLLELAERVASKKLDLESWRTSQLPTDQLYKVIRSVKGVGDYAAGNILKLLGRYDYLGLDSWVRAKFYKHYRNGRKVSDKTIEQAYAQYGKWRGLFFWLEMTSDWYTRKFPF